MGADQNEAAFKGMSASRYDEMTLISTWLWSW